MEKFKKVIEENGEELKISLVLYKIIKTLVKDWHLSPDEEAELHKIASQEIMKQYHE